MACVEIYFPTHITKRLVTFVTAPINLVASPAERPNWGIGNRIADATQLIFPLSQLFTQRRVFGGEGLDALGGFFCVSFSNPSSNSQPFDKVFRFNHHRSFL